MINLKLSSTTSCTSWSVTATIPASSGTTALPLFSSMHGPCRKFPGETWQTMLARVRAQTEVQLIADSTDVSWADLFDGLHIYIPVSYVVSGTDMQRIYDALVLGAESRW